MLSSKGWIDGISATSSFIFAVVLGLGIIYQARKLNTKLLLYMGLNIFLAGFFWLIPCLDFLTILLTGQNLPNPFYWMGILNYIWAPLVTSISMYIAAELMIPAKKQIILIVFLILTIIFELIIIIFPRVSFEFAYPSVSGDSLIYIGLSIHFPITMLLYFIFSLAGISFCGFGYLIKGIKSSGVIKKKFLLLSIGYFLFLGFPLIRSLVWYFGIIISITYVRIGMVSSFLFFYWGLKEEPEVKIHKKDDIKIEESLFRLSRRPTQFTEEEISFYREKRICLVCKGKVAGLNYMCTGCNALYCMNCSEELSDLENACWVCNEPFDKTKPSKPFLRIEEEAMKDVKREKK